MINKRQILIIIGFIILLLAIPVTLYLVRQTQIFNPKAAFIPKAEFLDSNGNVITQTSTKNVRLKIIREVAPTPSPASSVTPSPSASPSPSPVESPTPSPTPGLTNLLVNGNFENNLSGWDCLGAISGSCNPDLSVKFSGNSSIKITDTGGSWGWQLVQGNSSNGIPAKAGDQFCLSVRVKKQNPNTNAMIAIQETGGSFQGQFAIHPSSSNTDWQLIKGTATVGQDWVMPIQAYLRVISNSGESAWFDEASVIRGACISSI